MPHIKPIVILEDIFSNTITVQSISSPTEALSLELAKRQCYENNYDVHLVRESPKGDLSLYVKAENTTRSLKENEVITESTPIFDAIGFLREQPFLFIKEKREIKRIVTIADIDSMPIRIWLFGMVSLLEWHLREFIISNNIDWVISLPQKRLDYAKELYTQKEKNNEEASLIDCTQIADLSTIILKNWDLFSNIFPDISKKEFKIQFNRVARLRNTLSHSLRLKFEWNQIYEMSVFISNTLKRI